MEKSIETTLKNLEKNGMNAIFVEKAADIKQIFKELIPEGATVGAGGSVTLAQCGVTDMLKKGNYNYLDRDKAKTPEQSTEILKKSLTADFFVMSSNAVTEKGELYNVDGRGNRVAALVFGPQRVIVAVGKNKIVPDVAAAVKRVKQKAAPENAARLNRKTPCAENGSCVSLKLNSPDMCDGCLVKDRICSSYLVSGYQMVQNRITVIICAEDLGY